MVEMGLNPARKQTKNPALPTIKFVRRAGNPQIALWYETRVRVVRAPRAGLVVLSHHELQCLI